MSSENNLEDRLSSYKLQPDGRVQYLPPEEEIEKEKERRLTGLGYLEENVRPILEKINSIVLGGKGEIFTTDPADLSLTDPHYPKLPRKRTVD